MFRFFRLWAVLLLAAVAVSCATEQTAAPKSMAPGPSTMVYPPNFRVVGYFPSWSGFDPTMVDFHKLTHVNWAFLMPESNGTIGEVEHEYKLTQLISAAHAAGCKVLLSVGGWLSDSPDSQVFVDIGASPDLSAKFAQNCIALVHKYNVDGIDIDWEFPQAEGKQNYATLITALAGPLHAEGKLLSAAVNTDSKNVLAAALRAVDFINIMAYDNGGGDNKPHSSREFATGAIDFWKNVRKVPAEKLNLGLPFYARKDDSWNSDSSYRTLVQDDPAAAQKDDSEGFNYNGIPTIQWKTRYALTNAGGVMIWELSQDATGDNSLLKAIFDAVAVPKAP